MRFFRRSSWVVAVLSVLALAVSLPVENSYASKAVLTQRVEQSEASSLFGETGAKIGSPQMLIISDESVFLPSGEDGMRLVDETKLKARGIYPLQLQTVTYLIGLARIGAAVALAAALVGIWLTGRKRRVAGSPEAVTG